MDSIKPLSPQAFIGSATTQGRGGNNQNFQLQDMTFKALVTEAQAGGRFVLEIGDSRIAANSAAALAVGQTLHLRVVKTEPHLELKIIDEKQPSPLAGRSLTLLGNNIDLSPLFQAPRQASIIFDTLPPINRDLLDNFYHLQRTLPDSKDAGTILKQLTEHLGLNLERLLASWDKQGSAHTLKAALLELVHQSSGNDRIIEGAAAKLIDTLELYQLAQLHLSTEKYAIYPLPLPFVEQGYLLVEQESEGTDSGERDAAEQKFSLHLTMSHLGHLRIDCLNNAEGLFIRFMADSQTKADFIAAFGDELRDLMTDTSLIGLVFSGGAGDPTGDLIRRLVPPERSMLDMKV